jgi:hypothetical protein
MPPQRLSSALLTPADNQRQYRALDLESILAVLEPLRTIIQDFERCTTSAELARIAATASRIPLAQSPDAHIVDVDGSII